MFYYLNCSDIKIRIDDLDVVKKIKKQDGNKNPYAAHAILLSQLLYILFSSNYYSVMFVELSPLLILGLSIFKIEDVEEEFEEDILQSNLSPENIENCDIFKHKPNSKIKLDKEHNLKNEFFEFLNENKLELLDLSIERFDKMFVDDGRGFFCLNIYSANQLENLFNDILAFKNKKPPTFNFAYKSIFNEFKDTNFTIKYGSFSKKINSLHIQNNLGMNINLDSLTVLSRTIILITIIEIMSEERSIFTVQHHILMSLFLMYMTQQNSIESKKTYKHVKFIKTNCSGCLCLPIDTFVALYGFGFKKIEKNTESLNIKDIDGRLITIKILDIFDKNFENIENKIQQIGSYIFNKLMERFSKALNQVLIKIKINPKVSDFTLRNCISCEMSRMINIVISNII